MGPPSRWVSPSRSTFLPFTGPSAVPSAVRLHESHPTEISSSQRVPGPGAYVVKGEFDYEYRAGQSGIKKGFTMGGRPPTHLIPGMDSPGPKYTVEPSGHFVKGGSMSKASRTPASEKRKAESVDVRSYTPNLNSSSTASRSIGVSFRPPGSESKRLKPEPQAQKLPVVGRRGHTWRQRMKIEEAHMKEVGLVSEDVHVVPASTHEKKKRTKPLCTFGHRPRDPSGVSPGPGEYNSGPYRPSSRSYRYMDGPGHSNLFGAQALGDAALEVQEHSVRPHSPCTLLYLTG